MPGLEPGTSRLSMQSECAYHLRYISVDPSAHKHSIFWTGHSGGRTNPCLHLSFLNYFFSNFFLSEFQFAVLAVSLMDPPTTLLTLIAMVLTVEVLAISGLMAPRDHQHTLRPTSSVLKLILLTLVLRLTEVVLLVTSVTNKCSPTSPWSTRFVFILNTSRNLQKFYPFAIGIGNFI